MFDAAAVLDLIIAILPDNPKEVAGQDALEGDLEEVLEDEEAEGVDQDTSQPETVAAQGETGVVNREPEKLDFPILT